MFEKEDTWTNGERIETSLTLGGLLYLGKGYRTRGRLEEDLDLAGGSVTSDGERFFAASVSEIGERKGTWWGFIEIALRKFG